MSKKLECPNCGARLLEEDRECYVCGMTVEEILKQTGGNQSESTYDDVEDNVSPQEEYDDDSYEYGDEEYDYEDENIRERHSKNRMSKTKKTGIICGICVGAVALIAAIVCLCFYGGFFSPNTEPEEYTIYFDKPLSDVNLIDAQGTVYNWGGDVEVFYTLDDENQESICKISVEYDNLWECKIPKDATDVYFSPSTTDNIRTEAIAQPEDEYVYYVTDTLIDESLRMAISCCPLAEFYNQGINYNVATEEETTLPPTEAPTEAPTVEETTVATETETETTPSAEPYSITVPSSWSSGTTVVTKDNCTTYYETYNYKNYQMGSLLSIYVVDASDTSFSNMNNVKMVKKTSDGEKKIVVVTPTDIQFNDADETATNNYISLSNLTNQVISSINAN
ncbi:MAG: hypothetical protein ACI4HO_01605 [Ruminococcus sp.]